jgi:hypothetical protein
MPAKTRTMPVDQSPVSMGTDATASSNEAVTR